MNGYERCVFDDWDDGSMFDDGNDGSVVDHSRVGDGCHGDHGSHGGHVVYHGMCHGDYWRYDATVHDRDHGNEDRLFK